MLPILYQDEYLVAVHKPAGLLVHRTSIDPQAGLLPERSLSGAFPLFLISIYIPPAVGIVAEGLPQALSTLIEGAAAGVQPASTHSIKMLAAKMNH